MGADQPNYFIKDPDAILDYGVDWAAWLSSGDTLATGTWVIPSGLTEVSTTLTNSNTRAIVWLSGGTVGQTYTAINYINTAQGRADNRTIFIVVREK